MSVASEFVFLLSCDDQPGILASAAQVVSAAGGDIRDAASFADATQGLFFVRIHLSLPVASDAELLEAALAALAQRYRGTWSLSSLATPCRVVIAVSKFTHCLNDLLYRVSVGNMPIELVAVMSNHATVRDVVERAGFEFIHLPVTKATRAAQEGAIRDLLRERNVDLLVLARYMQILSDELAVDLAGRCINIHHSFLPSFKGARPYHQAYERGVKLIGATAHYVTGDLDEGPIIEQDVRRVTHATSADEMVALGREIECSVLARAVRWHAEHRVLVRNARSVVFN
ncbi:MAG: formyltetrahydrofolate deformylase [Pseudomonadota bacterium]